MALTPGFEPRPHWWGQVLSKLHQNRICLSTPIRHVSGFTPVPRTGEYWQQSKHCKAHKICILLCLERTWEWGYHLEYSIHGKELGLILLHHRIKKYLDLASTQFWIDSVFKHFHSGEWIRKPDLPDTCGWKLYPERKSCWIKKYPDTSRALVAAP